jgi:hypothetical protein
MNLSQGFIEKNLQRLDLPYRVPSVAALAVLWPVDAASQGTSDDGESVEAESP